MFKFLNCFLNSFFRTLGRIIVYILLGLVFSTILSKIDVHADMATPQEIIFDNTTYSTYYEIPVFYPSYDLRIRINDRLRNFSTIGTENTNLILDICSSAPLNIWRTYAAGSGCSTSCFSQLVQIKQIPNLTCRTYTYNDNKAYRIVLPINLWNMSGVTSPELDNISFDDKITLSNSTPHDVYASIYGAYYSSIGFDINNQDALFSDLNQTQQNILNKQNEINNNINDVKNGVSDINSSLNNSDTTDASNDANNFFNNFTTELHGLTGIITVPLNAINSLTNKTCSPLVLPLPFVDKDLTLPCMRSIYDEHFGDFMTLYDTITFGIVSYWVCVRIFSLVKDFKNPEHDEIEVVDL